VKFGQVRARQPSFTDGKLHVLVVPPVFSSKILHIDSLPSEILVLPDVSSELKEGIARGLMLELSVSSPRHGTRVSCEYSRLIEVAERKSFARRHIRMIIQTAPRSLEVFRIVDASRKDVLLTQVKILDDLLLPFCFFSTIKQVFDLILSDLQG